MVNKLVMFLWWLQAENVVLALRDLFQTVYEMKKKEIEEAKAKATAASEGQGQGQGDEDNPDTTYQVSHEESEKYIKRWSNHYAVTGWLNW